MDSRITTFPLAGLPLHSFPQFFTGSSFLEKLPPEEKELMTIYLKLDEKDRSRLLSYARRIFKQNEKETTL